MRSLMAPPAALLVGGTLLGAAACSDSASPAPLSACAAGASGQQLQLPVGGVRIFDSPRAAGCVTVPAGGDSSDYLFVVSNASLTLDKVAEYTFRAEPGATTPVATTGTLVTAPRLVAPSVPAATDDRLAALEQRSSMERALRQYERIHLDPRALAPGAAPRSPGATRGALVQAAIPAIGETIPFRVPREGDKPCDNFDSISAVVKAVGQKAIVVQDVAAPANGFADADFAAIASEFDNLIYPVDTDYFGAPTDIDQNGRVFILFTPLINKLTPRTAKGLFAGFFFAGDFYPRTGTPSCTESNLSEVFYLLVPDPTGQYSIPASRDRALELGRGTVAHEFQHMINAGQRFQKRQAFEEPWLDEGLAHFAEEAVGRASRQFGDLQELSFADIFAVQEDYYSFFDQNLLRFRSWLARPDTSSGPSERTADNLSGRGAAWAMVRYASERYSGGNVRDFTRRLAAGPETGLANLTKRAGVSYDDILSGFVLASFADDLAIAGLDSRYTYSSWRLRDAVSGAVGATYPLQVNDLPPGGASIQSVSRSGAATYFRYTSAGPTPSLAGRVLNRSEAGFATFPGARLYVLRVR
ncbi:MAG: hypothetical protein ACJ79S_04475 [Gemmatimonadaceae bacterium]